MKICTKCGTTKPVTEFCKDAMGHGGLKATCKLCQRAYNAAYCVTNKRKIAARKAAYRIAHPGKAAARTAKWRVKNPDKVMAKSAKWYAANSDKQKASAVAWRKANPEGRRIHEQNRRARKLEVGGEISPGLADKLHRLQRGKCACCKQPLGEKYHRDHRMPLALGGPNEDSNMQLLCATCNLQKGKKHPINFMQQKGFLL